MTRREYLLNLLQEECCETAVEASKALRFTPEEIQEGQTQTNAERLVYEFNDIVAVMQLLKEEGIIPNVLDFAAIQLKRKKIEEWYEYAKKKGTIEQEWVDCNKEQPSAGAEYNVVWDLNDNLPPVSATMEYDFKEKKWFDLRNDSADVTSEVLFWKELPKYPKV